MRAMILAAGLGTRLRPLTLERAKPAIPLLGTPLIVRLVQHLQMHGTTHFRVNLHHLPETVEKAFQDSGPEGADISFAFEPEILGTAGGLKNNEAFFHDETFVMVNADIVMDFPLHDAIARHRRTRALATLVVIPQQEPFAFYPLQIDEDGHLLNFKNVPPTGGPRRPQTYVFTGVHIVEPRVFDFIPPGRFYEINDQVYPEVLRSGGDVRAFPVQGYWNDVGNPARYLRAQRDLFSRWGLEPSTWRAESASVHDHALGDEFVSIGPGSEIEAGCLLRNAILWENVRVGRSVTVSNAIIGEKVTLSGDCINRVVTRHGEAPLEPESSPA